MPKTFRTEARPLAAGRTNSREEAVLQKSGKCVQTVLWDFAEDGGDASADIEFGAKLPANAVVTNVYRDVQTTVAGATGVILKAGSTALTAATDLDAEPAANAAETLDSSATAIKLDAASELKLDLGATDATAGKVRYAVEFYVSDE